VESLFVEGVEDLLPLLGWVSAASPDEQRRSAVHLQDCLVITVPAQVVTEAVGYRLHRHSVRLQVDGDLEVAGSGLLEHEVQYLVPLVSLRPVMPPGDGKGVDLGPSGHPDVFLNNGRIVGIICTEDRMDVCKGIACIALGVIEPALVNQM